MSQKTSKTEKAIEFIAKQGRARSADIGKAAGFNAHDVAVRLQPYVRGGVLVSCRVQQTGKASCNEYRLATGVTLGNWRDFNVYGFTKDSDSTIVEKSVLPPAQSPADRPEVSVTNTGSTSAGLPLSPPIGRAVTKEKPAAKAAQHASAAGGHVFKDKKTPSPPEGDITLDRACWSLWNDGRLVIFSGGSAVNLSAADARRLADFLCACDGALEATKA